MNILYDTIANEVWTAFARALAAQRGYTPAYWISDQPRYLAPRFPGCTMYFTWDAFKLRSAPATPGADQHGTLEFLERLPLQDYFNYIKLLDRVDHNGTFTFAERDRLLKEQVTYWRRVLDSYQIGMIIGSNLPHLPHSYALYLVARQVGIPYIFSNNAAPQHWHYFLHDLQPEAYRRVFQQAAWDGAGDPAQHDDLWHKAKTVVQEKYGGGDPYYLQWQKRADQTFANRYRHVFPVAELQALREILTRLKKGKIVRLFKATPKWESFKRAGVDYHETRMNIFEEARSNRQASQIQRQRRAEMARFTAEIDPDAKFIYVPLHYQPEATTTPLGGFFGDQLLLIEALADHLPAGWQIYVKEHYSQFSAALYGHQGRSPGYYRRIAALKAVRLVSMDVTSEYLIDRCQAVASVTGTAGWEALVRGKPCLVFGQAWYLPCGGAFGIQTRADLQAALETLAAGYSVAAQDIDAFLARFARFGFVGDLHTSQPEQGDTAAAAAVQRFLEYTQALQSLLETEPLPADSGTGKKRLS